jgi:hypothetical protein
MADITAARNTFGQYIRQRGPANNTASGSRSAARVLWAAAVSAWQALTDAQRLEWYAWAERRPKDFRICGRGPIGGMQAFIQAYVTKQGGTVTPGAPVPAVLPLGPTFASPSPTYDLTVNFTCMAPMFVGIYTAGYSTTSTYAAPGRGKWWGLIGTVDATAIGPYPVTVNSLQQTAHAARWGAVVAGARTFVAVRAISAGGCGVRLNCGFVDW